MARLNTNAEVWDALTEFGRMIDSTSASTGVLVTAAAAAGATTFTVAGMSSGLSTGTYVRVGPAGGAQICYITATSTADLITLRSQLAESISTGEAVLTLARVEIGCPDDNGVATEITTDITTINSACQRNAYAHLVSHTDASVTVGLLNVNPENLLATVGDDEANISGANTAANPSVVYWLPDNFDSVKPVHFYAKGTLKDGSAIEVQFWDCDIDPAKSFSLGRGSEVTLGLTFFPRIIAYFDPLS